MPRKNRYFTQGQLWHVTHRCHNRDFLLKFAKDRAAYRNLLRKKLCQFEVDTYGYCLTSNHVHLLLRSIDGRRIAPFMKSVAGEFAQAFNRRKRRSGAFWSDRYHATLIDTGDYLWRCLQYIDLNMVRAGQVRHPAEWPWCGYHELTGGRKRYRLLSMKTLAETLDYQSVDEFGTQYSLSIDARLADEQQARESCWAESLAVGSRVFVESMAQTLRNRKGLKLIEPQTPGAPFILRERGFGYTTA